MTTITTDPQIIAAVERLESHIKASERATADLLDDLLELIQPVDTHGPHEVVDYFGVEPGDMVMWDQQWHIVNGAAVGETDGSAHLCFRDGSDCCDDRATNLISVRKRLVDDRAREARYNAGNGGL